MDEVLSDGRQAESQWYEAKHLEMLDAMEEFEFTERAMRVMSRILRLTLRERRLKARVPVKEWFGHFVGMEAQSVKDILAQLELSKWIVVHPEGLYEVNVNPLSWNPAFRRKRPRYSEFWWKEHLRLNPEEPLELKQMRRFRAAARADLYSTGKSLNEGLAEVDMLSMGLEPDRLAAGNGSATDLARYRRVPLPTSAPMGLSGGVEAADASLPKAAPNESSPCSTDRQDLSERPSSLGDSSPPGRPTGPEVVNASGSERADVALGDDASSSRAGEVLADSHCIDPLRKNLGYCEGKTLLPELISKNLSGADDGCPPAVAEALDRLRKSFEPKWEEGERKNLSDAKSSPLRKNLSTRAYARVGTLNVNGMNEVPLNVQNVNVGNGDFAMPRSVVLMQQLREIFAGKFPNLPDAFPEEMTASFRFWRLAADRFPDQLEIAIGELRSQLLTGYRVRNSPKFLNMLLRKEVGEERWSKVFHYRVRSVARELAGKS